MGGDWSIARPYRDLGDLVVLKLMRGIIMIKRLLLLLIFSTPVLADHNPGHPTLTVGKPSRMIYKLPACDTKEQMMEIAMAKWEHGFSAAKLALQRYHAQRNELNQPVCGFVSGLIRILRVIEEKQGDKVVEFEIFDPISGQGAHLFGVVTIPVVEPNGA